jgi:hypothetical protein
MSTVPVLGGIYIGVYFSGTLLAQGKNTMRALATFHTEVLVKAGVILPPTPDSGTAES